MSRVFITGSSDGLGLMAARLLVEGGHHVTLHARNANRAEDTRHALPQAKDVVPNKSMHWAGMMPSSTMPASVTGSRGVPKPSTALSIPSRSTCWRPIC
jgi:NAD(P)-dependent dehydrogenase (short-subunit alcohol dehydrogenase family)